MWVTIAIILILVIVAGALLLQKPTKNQRPIRGPDPTGLPAPGCCCLAIPTSAGGKPLKDCKGCHHDLCCDSLCPSLSQYYDPMTKSCLERPQMPYGYNLASGPCITNFQWCSANPPEVPKPFPSGLPAEEAKPCDTLCDRFGGTLIYTGFNGAPAQKPAFVPSTYDGFQSFMGSEYANNHYVST